jgi:hypothetical protein
MQPGQWYYDKLTYEDPDFSNYFYLLRTIKTRKDVAYLIINKRDGKWIKEEVLSIRGKKSKLPVTEHRAVMKAIFRK